MEGHEMEAGSIRKRGLAAALAVPLTASALILVAPAGQAADTATTSLPAKSYSLAQVKRHHTAGNCWSIVGRNVYNLTAWVPKHPGGRAVIIKMCGRNGTALFNSQHRSSRSAKAALAHYKIGTLR